MKNQPSAFAASVALLVALSVALMPSLASAANSGGGGGGGGGGGKTVKTYEARVTGYVTAIDYVNSTITIGASYYGSGALKVDASTSISMDNVSCDFNTLELGDWVEARYDFATKVARKLSATSTPSP